MTSWRPGPSLQPTQGNSTHKRAGLVEALREQFRAVMKTLTRSVPKPQSKPRRRRDETRGLFRRAATKAMRRIILPQIAYFIAGLSEHSPRDLLNPYWTWPTDMDDLAGRFDYGKQNHLSLDL